MAFGSDTFTDTAGVALGSHTATLGGPWVEHSSYATNDPVISDANRLRSVSSASTLWYLTAGPVTAEYDVATDVFTKSIGSADAGVAGRIATGADTYYYAKYDGVSIIWQLLKVVAGVETSLGTYGQTLVDETSYALKLEIRDATKKLYVDGVERISSTDNAITAAGKAGVHFGGSSSNSAGKHLDNFAATDVLIVHSGTAAISGGGALVASGRRGGLGAAVVTGGGALVGSGSKGSSGAATLSGGGSAAAVGKKGGLGVATLSGGGSLTASGSMFEAYEGTAAISGGGTLVASGVADRAGAGSLSAGGLPAASGVKNGVGAAVLTGGGALTGTGALGAQGTATISGGGAFVVEGFGPPALEGTAEISGGGTITATGAAYHPPIAAIRLEHPPDELAVYIENADGSSVRMAGDETDLPLADYTLATTLPGGFATADAVATMPEGSHDLRFPSKFAAIVFRGPDREVAWEGRLDAPVERPTGGELRLTCVGHQAALTDHEGVVFLGCDNDMSAWQDPPRARIKVGADSIRTTNALFTLENSEGGISLTMEPDRAVKQQDRGEVWYLAPAGQVIAEVQYLGSEVQGTSMLPRIYRTTTPGATPELVANMTLDFTVRKAPFWPPQRYVFVSDSSDSGQTKSARVVSLSALTVFGDHGLPRVGIDDSLLDGLRFSDILAHLVDEYAPALRTRYQGISTIEPSHYVMSRAMWTDPTTIGAIIEEGVAFEPGREWAVWDDRRLHYRHRENFGKTWTVRRSEGADFIDSGETGAASYNGVIVTYEQGDGEPRRMGPPDSGADVEDAKLADMDPENPVNAAAHMGDRYLLVDSQAGTPAEALQIGQEALREATRTRFTGEVQLPRYAECEGHLLPTWMLRAGDRIVDGDRRKEKELPVAGTSYQRGQLDRPMTATIDTPANRLDAAIARMTSTPEPLKIRKLKRLRKRANRDRRGAERKARRDKKNGKGGKQK